MEKEKEMVGAGIPVAEHVKLPLVDSSKVNVVFSKRMAKQSEVQL